jgi:hypothetical protein
MDICATVTFEMLRQFVLLLATAGIDKISVRPISPTATNEKILRWRTKGILKLLA